MADFIYCGTDPPVGADATQHLLRGEFSAIWCPPIGRHVVPAANDRVWLVWRPEAQTEVLLLGEGRIRITENNTPFWNNRTLRGVRLAAEALGYGGPTNMEFLHLSEVVTHADRPSINLGVINTGLQSANVQQVQRLSALLPIS